MAMGAVPLGHFGTERSIDQPLNVLDGVAIWLCWPTLIPVATDVGCGASESSCAVALLSEAIDART